MKDKKSLLHILNSNKTSHQEKIKIFVKSIDNNNLNLFANDCAENVLHIFEKRYPNNNKAREAILAAKDNNTLTNESARIAAIRVADAAYSFADTIFDSALNKVTSSNFFDVLTRTAAANALCAAADAADVAVFRTTCAAEDCANAAFAASIDFGHKIEEELKQIEIMKRYL